MIKPIKKVPPLSYCNYGIHRKRCNSAALLKHKLLTDDQHWFIPGRNCMTQLLLCMDDWTILIERGETFDVIYTDFAKEFDSVAHERLLLKLERVGIIGDLLKWIRSFLCGRTQCICIE